MRTPNGEQLQICYSYARLENDDVQERKPYHLEVKLWGENLDSLRIEWLITKGVYPSLSIVAAVLFATQDWKI